jgi:hypothetical protein
VGNLVVVAAAAALAAVVAGLGVGGNGTTNDKTFQYAIGLWGDLPYSDPGRSGRAEPDR